MPKPQPKELSIDPQETELSLLRVITPQVPFSTRIGQLKICPYILGKIIDVFSM